MNKIQLAVCGILVFVGFRGLADDLTIEGNLNVTSNLTSQSLSSLGAAVGLLIVQNEAIINGKLSVPGPSIQMGPNAVALHTNTFIWSDGTPFGSSAEKQFSAFAENGFWFMGGAIYGNGVGLTNLDISMAASGSITSDKLADGAVTASKLATGSVGTNNAVKSEWNAWVRAQVPAQTQQVYVATSGAASSAITVIGAQSNTIATAVQPNALRAYVPYTGATGAVYLGSHAINVGSLSIPGKARDSSLKIGSLEFQSYSLNNSWVGDNVYFDGSAFKYRAAGSAGLFYFYIDEGLFRMYPAGTSRSSLTSTDAIMKMKSTGEWALGGAQGSGTLPVYGFAGAHVYKAANGNFLIGSITDDKVNKLQVNGSVSATSFVGNGASLSGVVKKSDTNGWTVSAHGAWITAAQVPAQTQQVYVANAGTAGIVTGVQSQLLTSALQPTSIINLVPYNGAASSVNLGTNSMTAKLFIGDGSGLTNLSIVATLAANSVTTEKISDGAVTGGKIASGMINSEHLTNGAVTVAKLSMNSNLNMNMNRVTNLALPANDGDAVTKAYLRAVLSAIPPQGDLSMGTFTNGAPTSFPLTF